MKLDTRTWKPPFLAMSSAMTLLLTNVHPKASGIMTMTDLGSGGIGLVSNVGVAAMEHGCTAFGGAFVERASEAVSTRHCWPSVSTKCMRQGRGEYASASSEMSCIAPENLSAGTALVPTHCRSF